MAVMRQLVAEAEVGDKTMPSAQRALAHWDWDAGTLRPVRYSANASYEFKQHGVERILRLSHAGDRKREHIHAELDFIFYLAGQGIPAMLPVRSKTGEYIIPIESHYAQFYASVFEYARGEQFLEPEALDVDQLVAWGRSMALVHKASESYQPAGQYRRPDWWEIIATIAAWLPEGETDARRYLTEAESWLSGLPRNPEDFGLLHWDFCIDNLAWHQGQYRVFDFDDAAYFWYAADLAFALEDVLALPFKKGGSMMDAFLSGYQAVRPAIDPRLETIPRFLRFMHLFKFARVLHAFSFADPDLDPPWMVQLRAKLARRLNAWRTGFQQPFSAGV